MHPGPPSVVLIADDDRSVLVQIRTGLEAFGYQFIEASSGAHVLSALAARRPDLLLLDVEMPGMGGVDVLRIVKANQSETGFGFVPVILMTARRGGGKIEGLELGADDFLIKPFDMLELAARVKSMLRLKRLQDALVERNRELDRANRELEAAKGELVAMTRTDALTGLFNRRFLDEALFAEHARAQRYRQPLACLMVDIDHFKRINDRFGHLFGDEVLRGVARCARTALRDVDLLFRYGGEELLALLPQTGTREGLAAAARLRAAVEAMGLGDPAGEALPLTVSVGVASTEEPTVDSATALVNRADQALYVAKVEGRNRVSTADDASALLQTGGKAVKVSP